MRRKMSCILYHLVVLLFVFHFHAGMCGIVEEMDSSDVIVVKTRLEDEKSKRLLLENDVEMLMLKVAKLEREKDGDTGECPTVSPSPAVAFTAKLTNSVSIASGATLVFDLVVTNRGSAYNSLFGHFRAPVAGTYMFTVAILCQRQKSAEVSIMKGDVWIASALAYGAPNSLYDQGSITVTLDLQADEIVYVIGAASRPLSHIYGPYYTMYSGFLLAE